MATGSELRRIGPYDASALRSAVIGLPSFEHWAVPHTSAPMVLNPLQPVVVPEVARNGVGTVAMDVPYAIERDRNGFFRKPAAWYVLKAAIGIQRRKVERLVSAFGLDDKAYGTLGLPLPDGSTMQANFRGLTGIADAIPGLRLRCDTFDGWCRETALGLSLRMDPPSDLDALRKVTAAPRNDKDRTLEFLAQKQRSLLGHEEL